MTMIKTIRCLSGIGVLALMAGCASMPTLEQQEQLVQANNLVLDQITTRAVVNAWGKPPLYHSEFSYFFVMPDFRVIPRSRVGTGEAPKGWKAGVHAGEGVYFAYPDRGWLLVFLDDRLAYKEELKAEELRALAKSWAYEDRFKTRLDEAPRP
ncbi:MAG: hypothetical protein A4E19_15835 [Nitrospira sp. SG-bin1]|nr:MAG: hypothetical protein A4E19_15835 [Nitrospira sp. SG-bin1]